MNPVQVLSDLAACVTVCNANGAHFFILSIINEAGKGIGTGTYAQIVSLNQAIQSAYPNNYIDWRENLVENLQPNQWD